MTTERPASTPTYASWAEVEHYLFAGQSTSFPLNVPGSSHVDYIVTDDRSIALDLELGSRQQLPQSPLPLIRIDEISRNGIRMARLRLTQKRLMRDFHDLLNAVADRVVAHDRTPTQAFSETVRAWSALLRTPAALGEEKRIGLIGELMVLNSIAAGLGWETAVESWKGPAGEEHDFGLPDCDIEAKTTSSEQRRHTIHGLGQLATGPDRPLWLVSIQLTRGGAHGRTLRECVEAVRGRVTDRATEALDRFDLNLAKAGWTPDAPDDERWSIRRPPLVLPVDDSLPRLTPDLLTALPAGVGGDIDAITYRIDLTRFPRLPDEKLPVPLRAFRIP